MSEEVTETQDSLQTAVLVSRSMPRSVKEIWALLMQTEGSSALLGEGAVLGNKGDEWTNAKGRSGVIRSFHPLEQIRFSYRSEFQRSPSMVDVRLTPEGPQSTKVEIKHSRLSDDADTSAIQRRWANALKRIEDAL